MGALVAAALAVAAGGGAGGCVETLPPLEGTASLRVEMLEPVELGSRELRLSDDNRRVTFDLLALDMHGEPDVGFEGTVDVYVHYQGSRTTPQRGARPLLSAQQMRAGTASGITLELPTVYGPTVVWVEHTTGERPSFATGTSSTLWYRDPFLVDVSRPLDEEALNALQASPLEHKQIAVTASRYGTRGRLVVTGVYSSGYTLSDVQCSDEQGTPPCTAGAYDHVFVYSNSRAFYEGGGEVRLGETIARLNGSVSEFNGLTEINFPQSFASDRVQRMELVPAPVSLQHNMLASPISLERLEAALVSIENGTVCALDQNYEKFGQWKLDIGGGCKDGVSVVTKGVISGFDPGRLRGKKLRRVVGSLRPVNIGNFHVWIVYPRDAGDLTLN